MRGASSDLEATVRSPRGPFGSEGLEPMTLDKQIAGSAPMNRAGDHLFPNI